MIDASRVCEAFLAWAGQPAAGMAFAPGRVNLIGEHIDYHDRSVLPIALELGVSIAYRPRRDGVVRACARLEGGGPNARYPESSFRSGGVGPASPDGSWTNYLKAAATFVEDGRPRGPASLDPWAVDCLVMSDLPEAAGLSSSSALVVASTLAFLDCAGQRPDLDAVGERQRLAAGLAGAERYVGTAGGGMDQAASLGGVAGHAIRIDFAPLEWTPVRIPSHLRWIVADSGVRAEKSGEARARYNQIRTRSDEPDIAEHIRSESARVGEFFGELVNHAHQGPATSDGESKGADTLELARRLGDLLNASHDSLRSRLRVSHPALDHLCRTAIDAGAFGARLTGAGFGGSIIALCDEDQAAAVVEALSLEGTAFVAEPGDGARLIVNPR